MTNISDYKFPSDLKYIFIDPISFFWIKKQVNVNQGGKTIYLLGFPEIITRNLNKDQLKFGFRSENLLLRENKPFLRLLTKNKLFEFLSPWKSNWTINPKIKNNIFSFLDHPYEEYIIECFDFEDQNKIESLFKSADELERPVSKILEKSSLNDCKDCPDLFQGSIVRRNSTFK